MRFVSKFCGSRNKVSFDFSCWERWGQKNESVYKSLLKITTNFFVLKATTLAGFDPSTPPLWHAETRPIDHVAMDKNYILHMYRIVNATLKKHWSYSWQFFHPTCFEDSQRFRRRSPFRSSSKISADASVNDNILACWNRATKTLQSFVRLRCHL
jgi:hypothetical protein